MRKLSKTNALPPGTQNVSVNMPISLAERLNILAGRTGVSRNQYCVKVLTDAADAGSLVTVEVKRTVPKSPDNRAPSDIELNDKPKNLTVREKR